MSAAEFAIVGSIVVLGMAGSHELIRLQTAKNALNNIAYNFASEISSEGLSHIIKGTFHTSEKINGKKEALEERIENQIKQTFKNSFLSWSWLNNSSTEAVITGVKVSTGGPHFREINKDTVVRIHVCLKSWVEPFLRILSDQRNCLGQFTKESGVKGESRGITVSVIATRASNIASQNYFQKHSQTDTLETRP